MDRKAEKKKSHPIFQDCTKLPFKCYEIKKKKKLIRLYKRLCLRSKLIAEVMVMFDYN